MLIARWQIDARFGHRQQVIDRLQYWADEIAPKAGLTHGRILTGSVGALGSAWDRLATIDAHAVWGKELEAVVVSGTARWEIFRVQ